jgi:hypothetical protein
VIQTWRPWLIYLERRQMSFRKMRLMMLVDVSRKADNGKSSARERYR